MTQGVGFVVATDQLQQVAGVVGDIGDRCGAAARSLGAGDLPAHAFGRTTHGPLLVALCTSFSDAMVQRMRSAAGSAGQLSGALRAAAHTYREADARAYRQVDVLATGGHRYGAGAFGARMERLP